MKTRLITAAVSALLVSGYAFAGSSETRTQMDTGSEAGLGPAAIGTQSSGFNELDTDQDGVISRSEAANREDLTDKWSHVDKDEDGQLDRAEFSAFEQADMEDRAKQLEDAADEAEDRIDRAN